MANVCPEGNPGLFPENPPLLNKLVSLASSGLLKISDEELKSEIELYWKKTTANNTFAQCGLLVL